MRYLFAVAIYACVVGGTPALSQSTGPVTKALAPIGGAGSDHAASDVTSSGEWVYFFDVSDVCVLGPLKQVSKIRSDGTGYEVVIRDSALLAVDAYPAPGNQMSSTNLNVDPDGSRGYFGAWTGIVDCSVVNPKIDYWFDAETGEAGLLTVFPDEIRYHPTISGVGRVCMVEFDPVADVVSVLVGRDIDGSDARVIYSAPPGVSVRPQISGDGETVLVRLGLAPAPYEGDLHLIDVATGSIERITFFDDPFLAFADISDDGSTVVASPASTGGVWVVPTDGSPMTKVLDDSIGSLQISGDGRYAKYWSSDFDVTSRLDLTTRDVVEFSMTGTLDYIQFNLAGRGMSYDGSVITGRLPFIGGVFGDHVSAWVDASPVLFTSGFATAGCPIRVDVGGELGSTWMLGMSLTGGALPLGEIGTLTLDPTGFAVLATGVVDDAQISTGSVTLDVPDDLPLTPTIDVHFQAFVTPPTGPSRLTNGTVMTLRDFDPFAAASFDPKDDPPFPATAPRDRTATSAERFRATLADLPIPQSPTPPNGPGDLTAEQRLALEIFADPIAWHRHGETVYPLLMQGYAADSPEVEAALYARRR